MSLGPTLLYAAIWLGWIKSWYILAPLPGKFNSSAVYALFPWGLAYGMLLLSVLISGSAEWDIWFILFLILVVVGLVFIIWCPSWLKPPWVRWLEREYGYCVDVLIDEARKMSRWKWESTVRTREGMQAWIDTMFAKRQNDINQRWEAWRRMLLYKQAKVRKGRRQLDWDAKIKGYIPEHRRNEEIERVRRGKRKKRGRMM